MSLTHCPVHNQPFKTIPGGVSKNTGKSYSAFNACPERGCREKPSQDGVVTTTSPTPGSVAIIEELKKITEILTHINETILELHDKQKKDLSNISF